MEMCSSANVYNREGLDVQVMYKIKLINMPASALSYIFNLPASLDVHSEVNISEHHYSIISLTMKAGDLSCNQLHVDFIKICKLPKKKIMLNF